MDAEQFEVLSKKVNAIIALLAMDKLGNKSKTDSMLFLSQLGLDNSTIASMLDSTPGSVSAQISKVKKNEGKEILKKGKKSQTGDGLVKNSSESEPVAETEEGLG